MSRALPRRDKGDDRRDIDEVPQLLKIVRLVVAAREDFEWWIR